MAEGTIFVTNPLPKGVTVMGVKLFAALQAVMAYHAPQVQSSARANARWTDRTGNARNGLFAKPYGSLVGGKDAGASAGIVLYHSVPYGIFLEVRWSGRYSTIVPTILQEAPNVMQSVNAMMGRL